MRRAVRSSVVVNPSSDGLFLYKTDDWGGGRVVPSPGLRAQAVIGDDDLAVRISVPAADIGKPKAVRVAVRSSQVTPNGVAKDWAAAAREFIPGWVARF